MSKNNAYCQRRVDRTIIEPTSEITSGKIDQIIVSQKLSTAPTNLFVWLTSDPPNLFEWKNSVWLVSLLKHRAYKSRCMAVSNVHTIYVINLLPITDVHNSLAPYRAINVHRFFASCSWLCWIMLRSWAIIRGPAKRFIATVNIAKNIAKFLRCLYGTEVFQNRRNISLLFGLFFKSIPFDNKLVFINCAENWVFLIIQNYILEELAVGSS